MPRRFFDTLHRDEMSCSPIRNCSDRDRLVTVLEGIDFDNGESMDCANSNYRIKCIDYHDCDNGTTSTANLNSVLWVVILMCVLIIIGLSISTYRFKKKYEQNNPATKDNTTKQDNEHNLILWRHE